MVPDEFKELDDELLSRSASHDRNVDVQIGPCHAMLIQCGLLFLRALLLRSVDQIEGEAMDFVLVTKDTNGEAGGAVGQVGGVKDL